MVKYIKNIVIMLLMHQSSTLFSQTSIDLFNTANAQYEAGNYSQAIQNLKIVEQSVGANPKVQSLLVYAYVANNDFVNATISLNNFKKLIGSKRNEAIQAVLDLEKQINNGVEVAQKKHQETVQKKRMNEAKQLINRQTSLNKSKQKALIKQFESKKSTLIIDAKPDVIKSLISNTKGTQKFDLLKSLRKEKKIKRSWNIQFKNDKLEDIVKLIYREFDKNGEEIKYLEKEYGTTSNATFGDYPKFEEKMVTKEYMEQLENSKDFKNLRFIKWSFINKDNDGNKYQVETNTLSKSGEKIQDRKSFSFKWKNDIGNIVKTAYEYSDNKGLYNNTTTYSDADQYVSRTYLNGKINSESKKELIKNTNTVTENVTSVSYQNNKKTSDKFVKELSFNELGDLTKSKGIKGVYTAGFSEDNIYRYDLYGNISYQDKYHVGYDYTYTYFFNFYEYDDGYKTSIEDVNNQIAAIKSAKPKLSKSTLDKNYNSAIINLNEGFSTEAKRLLETCLDAAPTNVDYLYWMAAIYKKAGFTKKATEFLDTIITINPSFAPAYHLKGQMLSSNYDNRLQVIEHYKLAADWGMSQAEKHLEKGWKTKYKTDKKLFSKENRKEVIAVKDGIYQYIGSKVVFAELTKGEKEVYFRYANKTADNRFTSTTEYSVYEQSKKNPNVYLWKPNPKFRIIMSDEKFYYHHPDGIIFFKLLEE